LSKLISDPYSDNIEKNLELNRNQIEITENTEIKNRSPNYILSDIFLEYRVNPNVCEEDEAKTMNW